MGINKTGRKTLDRLAKDPRIDEIWDEGSDGYWASLKDGFNADGCSCLHEWTVKDLLHARGLIEAGAPYSREP
jgi:hypothetical protein